MTFFHTLPSGEISLRTPAPEKPAPLGVINLAKGSVIELAKQAVVTATVSWPPATDYDVYAIVAYRDGRQLVVSTFGTREQPHDFTTATPDGAVRHLGDVQRSSNASATETLEIRPNPDIVAIVPVVYSAQSNGTGSFHRYKVSMRIDDGAGSTVVIDATTAERNDRIYTCVPGIVRVTAGGLSIENLELYSKPASEHRPVINSALQVDMDLGPVNAYK